VGWIATIGALGNALDIPGLFDVQVLFTIVIAGLWVILAAFTVVAFWRGKILYAKEDAVIADSERQPISAEKAV
jgi:hypothetical protein